MAGSYSSDIAFAERVAQCTKEKLKNSTMIPELSIDYMTLDQIATHILSECMDNIIDMNSWLFEEDIMIY